MNKRGIMLVGIMLSLAIVYASSFTSAETIKLQLANSENLGDAYVGGAGDANKNFGTSELLNIGSTSRTYITFNLSSIPSNKKVDNALLCLYVLNTKKTQLINISRVYSDWQELGLTWNNQPCGINFDNNTNCNLTAESSVQMTSSIFYNWLCWNVTQMVGKSYNSNNKNISMVLSTQDALINSFSSKEEPVTSQRPYLNITYSTADISPPNLTINSPLNQSYTNATILLNISAADANLQSIWWYNGSSNITYSEASYYSFPEGSNTIIAYANDSNSNVNSSSLTFYVDSISPELTIISPESKTYSYNTSLSLNYTASDTNLRACWYNLDSSPNISLGSCQNATFNASEENHIIYLYANDSLGNINSANTSFSINTHIAISLEKPLDSTWLNYSNIEFNYTVNTGASIKNCSLFLNGILNQTNSSYVNTSGGINSFYLNLSDSSYSWNILCSNTYQAFALNNYTINIDTIKPQLTLSGPTGTKTSRSNIIANWQASDTNLQTCYYNVYRGAIMEISDTAVNCNSASTTFDVTVDANFIFNLYANDSAGNTVYINKNFTVSTSSGSSPSTSGGGGGGSSSSGSGTIKYFDITGDSSLIANAGEKKKLELKIKNIVSNFMNDCRIKTGSSWVANPSAIVDLNPGQSSGFILDLITPQETPPGLYNLSLAIICEESAQNFSISLEIIEKKLGLVLVEANNLRDSLEVNYTLKELSGKQQNVELQIILFKETEKIAELKETRTLQVNEEKNFKTILELNQSLSGTFNLVINANSDIASAFLQEEVIASNSKIGGLAVYLRENTANSLVIGFLVAVFGVFTFLILRRIYHVRRLTRN